MRNECVQRIAFNATLATREFLKLLIGVIDTALAHDGLNRFSENIPTRVQMRRNFRFIDFELVEAAREGVVGKHTVAECHTHIAQHRRIGEVALPTRNR